MLGEGLAGFWWKKPQVRWGLAHSEPTHTHTDFVVTAKVKQAKKYWTRQSVRHASGIKQHLSVYRAYVCFFIWFFFFEMRFFLHVSSAACLCSACTVQPPVPIHCYTLKNNTGRLLSKSVLNSVFHSRLCPLLTTMEHCLFSTKISRDKVSRFRNTNLTRAM